MAAKTFPPTRQSILWRNHDDTVVVIDIPRSIASAQGTTLHPVHDVLKSCAPLTKPFANQNEPKSADGGDRIREQAGGEDVQYRHTEQVATALHEARASFPDPFCLERTFIEGIDGERGRKRPLSEGMVHERRPLKHRKRPIKSGYGLSWQCDCNSTALSYIAADDLVFVTNRSTGTETLKMTMLGQSEDQVEYRMPPNSSFALGNCEASTQFRSMIRDQASEGESRYRFDVVLLDPPWPNRSVKRTYRTDKGAYRIAQTLADVETLLHNMDLDMLLERDGYVGIWITNKPSIRDLVLGDGGLFATLGAQLVEEWIWLKVTTSGEPVTPLDGAWRRPYEVFLLGRRGSRSVNTHHVDATEVTNAEVKQRVILAVPDFHSRKPCLKEMVDTLLLEGREDGRVLECFARHLTAGWWSWGDECSTFNNTENWRLGEVC